jgi:hypothetical protein
MTQTDDIKMVVTLDRQERQPITRVWQKWRFSAPQTHLWIIKVRFSASTFVVKIATFAKPENVIGHCKKTDRPSKYRQTKRMTANPSQN